MAEPPDASYSFRVAAEIRSLLARHRIPQTDVADTLDMSQASVSRRLTGETPLDVNELQAIASRIGVPITDLLPVA